MSIERRRDRRYPFRSKVVVAGGRSDLQGETEDVSYTGLSLLAPTRLAERQFVRLRVALPPGGGELTLTGMVTRSSAAPAPGLARAGIQLYGLAPEQRERWNRVVRLAAEGAAGASTPSPTGDRDLAPRRYPRYAAMLQVRLHTVADLQLLYTLNVSKGGLFVRTKLALEVGKRVKVSVVHPRTGEQFPLDAVVRHRAETPEPGLGLELVGLSDQRRDEFFDFFRAAVPIEEVFYVASRDAHLPGAGRPGANNEVAAPGPGGVRALGAR